MTSLLKGGGGMMLSCKCLRFILVAKTLNNNVDAVVDVDVVVEC